MAALVGAVCLAAVPALVWLAVWGARHPEMSFWKHPILLGPFARTRWFTGMLGSALALLVVGIDLVAG